MKIKQIAGAALCAVLLMAEPAQALSGVSVWAHGEVARAEAAGLMPAAFGALSAREHVTRAEFCAVAVRLFESGTGRVAETADARPFTDTEDAAVVAASALGLVSGRGDGTFDPDATITRQELCVMLGNVLRAGASADEEIAGSGLQGFPDAHDVAPWASRDMTAMVCGGIVSGIIQDDGEVTLSPRETATREQSLMMAVRFLETYALDDKKDQDYTENPEENNKAPEAESTPPPDLPDRPLTDAEKEALVFGSSGRGYDEEEEARAAMCDITVSVWRLNADGSKTAGKMTLTVNRNLAEIYKAVFAEIFAGEEKFPIKNGGSYAWRANTRSEHRWGTAVDLNWEENMECDIDADGNVTRITAGKLWAPGENPYSVPADGDVVRAFKKYGFAWGGDAWKSKRDYMHFSFFGR